MAVFLSVLSVIWLVLKWILLIVAGIFGLVIVILLIVLLMPLSYRIEADRKEFPDASEEEKEKLILKGTLEAHVRVYWFLRLIQIKLDFAEKKLSWSAKVAWKKLAGSEEETSEEIPEETEELTEPEPEKKEEIVSKPEPEKKEEIVSKPKPEKKEEIVSKPKPEKPTAEPKAEPPEEADGPAKVDLILDQVDQIIDKLSDMPEKVEETIDKKLEPVIVFWNKLDRFSDKDKALKAVLKLVKREVTPILPKRVKADIDWGIGDPYLTSKIDGYRVMLAAFLFPKYNRRRTFNSYPDLMNRRIEFSISMSDWFLLGGFIPPIIAALLNIHIWHLIKFVKNLKSQEKDHGKQK
ncbi:MAG: hypothetical protein IKG51_03165 [Firmicutes bacterium]|nr:hypothetical protein [Bacillota bacterium]